MSNVTDKKPGQVKTEDILQAFDDIAELKRGYQTSLSNQEEMMDIASKSQQSINDLRVALGKLMNGTGDSGTAARGDEDVRCNRVPSEPHARDAANQQ